MFYKVIKNRFADFLIIINLKFIYGRDYWSIEWYRLGNALIVLCLGTGLYFSIRTRFLQVRHQRNVPIVI
jgi:Na+/alanine symporter